MIANDAKPTLKLKPEPEKTHVAKEFSHKRPLISCRFDGKGRYVFAGSEDATIQRWDLESGKNTPYLGHETWPFALATTPDGETLFSGGCEGLLIKWSATAEKPTPLQKIVAHQGWVRSLCVSPDGALVASTGNDKSVKIWSFPDGKLVRELKGHEKLVYSSTFDPTGKILATADLRGFVLHWEVSSGKQIRKIDATKLYKYEGGQGVDYGGVRDLSFSADGKLLACSGLIEASNPLGAVSTPAVVLVDWAAGKEKLLQRPKDDLKGVAWGVRFHPEGFIIAAAGGSSGGLLFFWKPDQPNEFFKFTLPNIARGLDMHPDGIRLATAHHDSRLRISAMSPKV